MSFFFQPWGFLEPRKRVGNLSAAQLVAMDNRIKPDCNRKYSAEDFKADDLLDYMAFKFELEDYSEELPNAGGLKDAINDIVGRSANPEQTLQQLMDRAQQVRNEITNKLRDPNTSRADAKSWQMLDSDLERVMDAMQNKLDSIQSPPVFSSISDTLVRLEGNVPEISEKTDPGSGETPISEPHQAPTPGK